MQNTSPYPTQEKSRYSVLNLLATVLVIGMLAYFVNYMVGRKSVTKAEPVATATAISVSGIATTVATYTSGKHPCTAISDECGDKATWKEWTDVDRAALTSGASTVLDCTHVFKRNDTGAGYNMDGATHTQIATWFSLSKADRIAFLNDCK